MAALTKQPLNINFAQGLDTKSDPFQVAPGRFLQLQNSVFATGSRLQKRNGFGALTSLSDDSNKHLCTFNGGLLAVGNALNEYSSGSNSWTNKGPIQPLSLEVLPIVRSSTNQTQADSAVASNGLGCAVFTDVNAGVSSYKYTVFNATTGQIVVAPTAIPVAAGAISGSPKVFVLGRYFIIVISVLITATNHLQYVAINVNSPTTISSSVDISSQYTPAASVAFDGVVANNTLYLAWNGSDGGGAIRLVSLSSTLVLSSAKVFTGRVATIMSLASDNTGARPIIYASFYNSGSSTGYTLAVDSSLNTVLSPTQIIASGTIKNIASAAQNSSLRVFYEVSNAYSYDSGVASNYINTRTVSQAGALGTISTLVRSVGLASKAFIVDSAIYFLAAYSSSYQPTCFLVKSTGKIISKIAYSNGGGYLTTGLPNAWLISDVAVAIPYLFKDLIAGVNKTQAAASSTPVYSQTGVNLCTYDFTNDALSTSEIGGSLHLSGGLLWQYDGTIPVEHGFQLWPDNVEVTEVNAGGSMIPQQYYYVATYEWTDAAGNINRSAPSIPVSALLVAPSNKTFTDADVNTTANTLTITAHGYSTGMAFTLTTDNTLPAPLAISTTYYVISVDANTIKVATSYANALAGTAIDITTTGTGTDTVHVTANQLSVQVNVPTLRLTYKVANPVKIVIYRWSTAQQTYYQVTSLTSPVLNDTTADSIQFIDTQADTAIIGNSILYTTGGVVENIAAPAVWDVSLVKSRLFLIDAEDRNLLWYSKQVIQNTPVELSDLFTLFVAPTIGAQGSTGELQVVRPMDDKAILFKKDAIYYLVGNGPDNTGANNDFSEPVFITSTVGSSNPASVVMIPSGLMFQSDKGIWLLGRDLSTSYIGAPVEEFNAAVVLSALAVPGTNQVRFTLDNGITLMYDYYFNQWGTFVNIPAISSTLYGGLHTYINSFGQAMQETPGQYLDNGKPVLMSLTTSWFNLAGLQGYERAYYFYLLGTYLSPHKLALGLAYDYNSTIVQNSVFTPDNSSPLYGGDSLYGGGSPMGGNSSVEQARVFMKQQKCQSFQITLSEIFDPSIGQPAGPGFTLSGLDLIVGVKKGYPVLRASKSIG